MLIDGNSLLNRAFYALPPLNNAEGVPTGAVFGFLNMFFRVVEEQRPDHLAVAFDLSGPTFRHAEYESYKATRAGMPDDLRPQLPMLKEALDALGVSIVEREGFEADDLIGTLAARAEERGWETVIVTGDRDALQLVSERTSVLLTRRGISEVKRYDVAAVRAEYGLEPAQIIDLKGLMGDTSDNIPGVPGVGEKTALKLVQRFGSVEGVLKNVDRVGGGKLPGVLAAHREQALLSKRLATIDRAAPAEVDVADLRTREPDRERARALFRRWQFRSLLARLERGAAADGPAPSLGSQADGQVGALLPIAAQVVLAPDLAGWRDAVGAWQDGARVAIAAFALAAAPHPGQRGTARRAAGGCVVAACGEPGRAVVLHATAHAEAVAALGALFGRSGLRLVAHQAKPLLVALLRAGHPIREPDFDLSLAAYLIDSERGNLRLEALAREYGVGEMPAAEEAGVLPLAAAAGGSRAAPPQGGDGAPQGALAAVAPEAARHHAAAAAHATLLLAERMGERIRRDGLESLYRDVELPLCAALAVMEWRGVRVERQGLDEMAAELERRIEALTQEIHALAGEPFNINSTKQLGDVLFGKLGLPTLKKTKTGYSTDSEVLEALAPRHEIAAKVLEHRTLVKLRGTYVDGLRALVDPATGRVHTTFQQTVAATGRLSSSDPGLQNIPIRLEEGRRIRRVFAAEPGWVLLTADYSQIELRILAHVSGDRTLQDAFHAGQDIHTRSAAEMFGVPMDQVTKEQRTAAKGINYGIAYGISDFGLARNVGVGRAEAKEFIERYFARYPGVKQYMERTVAECRARGYVTTLLGRRRYLPDINSPNHNLRSFAERMAINTPIQGTAADILKVAMVSLHRELDGSGRDRWRARMILTVHDELVFELPPDELRPFGRLVVDTMQGAMRLTVPLVVEAKTGPNWYDLTPLDLDGGPPAAGAGRA